MNPSNPFDPLEKMIDVSFKDKALLSKVFIHKSYLNETTDKSLRSNERLEFLGDAVLELVVTEFLFKNYPNDEGELTNWRSALVKGAHLAKIAKQLELGQYLMLSHGEENSGGRKKNYILANTFEALIGAIYIEHGYDVAHTFIDKFVLVYLEEILEKGLHVDPKSKFQELAQSRENVTPAYRVIEESGPDHEKIFTMGAYLSESLIATGQGSSKQNAEQDAALQALRAKGWHK